MDKSLILNELKKHYKFKNDGDFAYFLGIKQNTLSSWKTRNTLDYDLIISKCSDIDANWIFSGKGKMTKKNTKDSLNSEKITSKDELNDQELELLKKDLETAKGIIEDKTDMINMQKDLINNLKEENQRLKSNS